MEQRRYVNCASLRRITPSTHVERLSGSHFDIGFQLAQLPGQRKVVEPKGGKSEELKVFEQMFLASCKTKRSQKRAAQLQERDGKGLGGGSMKNHGSKQGQLDSLFNR